MLDTVSMGKRIRENRLKKNLTIEQLAEQLEISADEVLFDSVRADTDIYLNEITKKMKRLDNVQIAKVEKVIDTLLKELLVV